MGDAVFFTRHYQFLAVANDVLMTAMVVFTFRFSWISRIILLVGSGLVFAWILQSMQGETPLRARDVKA
jgi:hypothetical protein